MAEGSHSGGSPQQESTSGNAKDKTETTATGQSLTHYHSQVYSLLSWERPRTTAVSFATVVGFIVAARYLPLLRWVFKFLYMSLGLTALLEVAGRVVLSRGLASSSRPRKYYTIPKDTIESVLEDLEQLVDFFLIEFQRILFVENLTYTVTAFISALSAYWLVRFLPLWGLALFGTCVAYLAPLIYVNNKELIDDQVKQIQELVNAQATQVKEMAGIQTAHASDIVRQYVGDYSAKAHDLIGHSAPSSPKAEKKTAPAEPVTPAKAEVASEPVKQADFPAAPSTEPAQEKQPEKPAAEPLLAL